MTGTMLKTILKASALLLAVAIIAGAVAYAAGLRVVLDGAGMPRVQFQRSADEQADAIAQHREAQRRQTPSMPEESLSAAPAEEARSAETNSTTASDAPSATAADPLSRSDWTGLARQRF